MGYETVQRRLSHSGPHCHVRLFASGPGKGMGLRFAICCLHTSLLSLSLCRVAAEAAFFLVAARNGICHSRGVASLHCGTINLPILPRGMQAWTKGQHCACTPTSPRAMLGLASCTDSAEAKPGRVIESCSKVGTQGLILAAGRVTRLPLASSSRVN